MCVCAADATETRSSGERVLRERILRQKEADRERILRQKEADAWPLEEID